MKYLLQLFFFLYILFCVFFPKLVVAQDSSKVHLNIFPKAFKTSAYFNFTLFKSDTVTLTVYNRWGEIMATLLDNERKEAGSYSYLFNGDTLPNGVYLYKLTTKASGSAMGNIAKIDSVPDFEIQIYPNPFFDFTNFFITNTKTDTISIDVYDMTGLVVRSLLTDSVMQPNNHRIIFNADTLKAGIYIARFIINKSIINRQIIKVNKTTSLAKSDSKTFTVKLFPNPCQNNITISGLEAINGKVEIVNSVGQIVKTQNLQSQQEINLQLSDVPAGAYFIRVLDNAKNIPSINKLIIKN